ncbi:protein ripply2 [Elgaria multicarinata webbii]|uniref:protein ripply2 n=1 Tax=Elgaria multicarinata webbii TaxID=159646 RepID=UPI002FCD3C5F
MDSSQLCLCRSPLGALNSRICYKELPGYPRFAPVQRIHDAALSEGFWRPWIPTPKDAERQCRQHHRALCSPSESTEDSAKLTQYTHPVRLFWPKSRCFDYLYQEAEALLRNFPAQATISFYEDSGSEEDSDEMEHDSEAELDN